MPRGQLILLVWGFQKHLQARMFPTPGLEDSHNVCVTVAVHARELSDNKHGMTKCQESTVCVVGIVFLNKDVKPMSMPFVL